MLVGIAHAQVAIPPLASPVADLTGTLSEAERGTLEETLRTFEARKGSQIAVLLVPTTQPETIEQYSIRVAEAWQLGRERVDDGVLLLVATEDRAVRIEVGYGLEGALTDATSNRIIEEVIVPRFRAGEFYLGLVEGVNRIIGVIDGEPLPEARRDDRSGLRGLEPVLPIVLMVALVGGGILRSLFGRTVGAAIAGTLVGTIVWLIVSVLGVAAFAAVIAFLLTLFGGGGGRGWYSAGRGRRGGWGPGGFGGGFGGGWSGGGGGFGGGGASGRW